MQASSDKMRRKLSEQIDQQQKRDDRQLKLRLFGYGVLLLLALTCLLTFLLDGPLAVTVATGTLFVCGLVAMEVQRKRRR